MSTNPSTNISVELSPENLSQLQSGETIRLRLSDSLEIQLSVFGGQVDAVRESIAKAKSRPASRE